MKSKLLSLFILFTFLAPALSHAATRTWEGDSSSNWSDPDNWTSSDTPDTTDDVVFDVSGDVACTVDNVGDFVGTITIAADYTQTVTQAVDVQASDFTINAGTWNDGGFNLSVSGNWLYVGGTYTTTGTVTFNPAADSKTITSAGMIFNNLTLAGTGATGTSRTVTIQDALDVNGNLTITTGELATGGFAVNVAGSWLNSDVFTHGSGTVTLDHAVGDTVDILSDGDAFYNLVINDGAAGATFELEDALDVNNDLTITAGTLDTKTGENNSIAVGNNFSNAGTFTAQNGTVTFDATDSGNTFNPGASSFYGLTFNGTGGEWLLDTNHLTVTNALTITAGTFDLVALNLTATGATFSNTNNGTLRLVGSQTITDLTMDTDTGTVVYNGGGSYAELNAGDAYHHLTFNGAGDWTLDAALDVNGNFTITDGTVITGGNNMTVAGSWSNADIFTHGSATVTLDGTATGKTITSGGKPFYNLTINGSGGGWTLADALTVSNAFTLTTGTLDVDNTNNYQITAGSWTQTGGTFTERAGTVILAPTANVNFTPLATAAGNFYNLNIGGLVGYWKLDETAANSCTGGANDSCDSSGYGRDGAWNSGATASATIPTLGFYNARSVTFDGTDDTITFSDSGLPSGSASRSVSAWIKTSSGDEEYFVFYGTNTTNQSFELGVYSDGKAVLTQYGEAVFGTSLIDDDAWHHVVGTYDGTNGYVYVDGKLENSGALTVSTVLEGGAIGWDRGGRYYPGLIDDVRIYNRVLTDVEIATLAAGTQPAITGYTVTLEDTLDVTNDFVLSSNTLDTKSSESNAISVAGNWYNYGGVLTPRAGTVTLDGTASGKYLQSGGQRFNNLTVNGTGGVWNLSGNLGVGTTLADGTLTISAGTLDADSTGNYNIKTKKWTQSAGTFTPRSGTVVLDSAVNQTFTPSSSFYNLRVEDATENGLVGYWKFDEGQGQMLDSSGNGFHATLTGNAKWSTQIPSASQVLSLNRYSYQGDGSGDYAEIPAAFSDAVEGDNITVAGWVYGNSASGSYANIATNAYTGTVMFRFGLGEDANNDRMCAGYYSGVWTHVCADAGDEFVTSTWTHYAATYNGTDMKIYRSGVEIKSTNLGVSLPASNDNPWYIGLRHDGVNAWDGYLDEVRIYNRTLSAAEVALLAAGKYADGDNSTSTQTLAANLDVNNSLSIDAGILAASTNSINVAADWNNYSGTSGFSSSGTVTLDGAGGSTQNVRGSNTFYDLSATGTTARTIKFESGKTQTIASGGDLTLTGAASQLLTLDPITAGSNWNLVFTGGGGVQTVSYVNVNRSYACDGVAIDANDGTNTNNGNNYDWDFTGTPTSCPTIVSIIGTLYASDESTPLLAKNVSVSVNGAAAGGTDATDGATGEYTIPSITLAEEDKVLVYVDGETEKGVAVTRYTGTSDITGLDIYENHLVVTHEDAGPMTNANLNTAHNGDEDIAAIYNVGVGTVQVSQGVELFIKTGKTFTPGGNVGIGTADINGTFTMGANRIIVDGTWDATGGSFSGSGAGRVIMKSAGNLYSDGDSFNDLYISAGLIGYWKLDETAANSCTGGANDSCDSSGYGVDGAWQGNATASATVPTVGFYNARSVVFDGTGDYVSMSDAAFPSGANARSVALWFKTSAAASQTAFSYGTDAANQTFIAGVYDNGGTRVFYGETSGESVVGTTAVDDDAWHHGAVTFDGTTAKVYVDGVEQASSAWSGVATLLGSANIGRYIGNNYLFDGRVDDVRLYNRALTTVEVAALAAGAQPAIAGETITLEDTLDVGRDLILAAGTLDTKSGENNAISVAGNWYNYGGVLAPRAGTVTLDGTASGKYLQSGGQKFNHLTVNGTGGVWNLNGNLGIGTTMADGTLTISAGTVDADSTGNYNIKTKKWTQSGGTFTPRSGTVILDSAVNQTFTPSSAFYKVRVEDPTESGLVAYWKADEVNGTTLFDYSGNSKTSTVSGTNVGIGTSTPSSILFHNPYSLRVAGTNGYSLADANVGIDWNGAATAWSWSVWALLDSGTAQGGIGVMSNRDDAGNPGWVTLGAYTTDTMGLEITGLWYPASPTYNPDGGGWTHYAVVHETNDDLKLYINGTLNLTVSNASTVGLGGSTQKIYLGSWYLGAQVWVGNIDDARVYNKALTQAEVTLLAAGKYADGDSGTSTQTLAANLDTNNHLSLDAGVLAASTYSINTAGDWNNYSGSSGFSSSGTVTLDGAGGSTQNVRGTNTFNNLTATATAARTLKFENAKTQTVAGTLTLTGASGQLLVLDPITAGSAWTVNSGTESVEYVDVEYSTASGTAITACYSTDGGNNTSWTISAGACGGGDPATVDAIFFGMDF